MGSLGKRTVVSSGIGLAVAVLALVVLLAGQSTAGAHSPRRVRTQALLAMSPGSFEISLGDAPAWLPLSGTRETLTLIGGAPRRRSNENAYVALTRTAKRCAPTPAASRSTDYELADFYSSAHSAARHAGAFAPDGGASRSTYIDSVSGVRFTAGPAVRACVWLTNAAGARSRSARRSLVASMTLPVLNRTFAASVSNLTGASAGSGGYSMYAFSAGHAFRYGVSTTQCGATSTDPATVVAAGTPASESVSISTSPCSGDASVFRFSGTDTRNASITYPVADALANPPLTRSVGACELDPVTGVSPAAADAYITAVGCRVVKVEVSPYDKALARGAVSWVSVDGGVAEIAPAGTAVDLVVNG